MPKLSAAELRQLSGEELRNKVRELKDLSGIGIVDDIEVALLEHGVHPGNILADLTQASRAAELRQLSGEELRNKVRELKEELFGLRFQSATGVVRSAVFSLILRPP
jgi:ribosomal protein L29